MSALNASANQTISLKSEDGVLFDVQAFHLMSGSETFRDMLSSSATDSTTPIDMPAHSLIIQLFVNLLEHRSKGSVSCFADLPIGHPLHHPSSSGIFCLATIIDILRQFECGNGLEERAVSHFEPFWKEDPWLILVYAGEIGDISLAKKAISLFGHLRKSPKWWTVDPRLMDPMQAEKLPLSWFVGYWRAYSGQYQETEFGARVDWQKVADDFVIAAARPPKDGAGDDSLGKKKKRKA